MNRFSKDIGAVDDILPRTMIDAIQIFAVMVGILVQVLIINWWIIFAVIVMGLLYGMIRNVYVPTAQNIKRLEGISTFFFTSRNKLSVYIRLFFERIFGLAGSFPMLVIVFQQKVLFSRTSTPHCQD